MRCSRLTLEVEPDPASPDHRYTKAGGPAFRAQGQKMWRCSCGSDMHFLCSLPAGLEFPREAGSPSQASGREDSYFLFRGCAILMFACAMPCKPRAVIAIRQG